MGILCNLESGSMGELRMICPVHRWVNYDPEDECPTCKTQGIIVQSVEFDKQDRVIDTMRFLGHEFRPDRSRAILIFDKGKEN